MTNDWTGYMTTWCCTNAIPVETGLSRLPQSAFCAAAKVQFHAGATPTVIDRLLRRAAWDQDLLTYPTATEPS